MTTPANNAPATLDAAVSKIDELLAATTGEIEMTRDALNEHVAEQLAKATADVAAGSVDKATARLEHMKAQVAAAKAIYDSGAVLAKITMFKDPWQLSPGGSTAKTAAIPQAAITPTGDSNVEFQSDVIFVEKADGTRELTPLFKALCTVAKASDTAPARAKLVAKADGATIIAKAGEAQGILAKIATLFAVPIEGEKDLLDCDFRWTISDTISALQSAAKLEGVMATMSAATAKVDAAVPAAAPTAKAAAPAVLDEAWPLDLAAAKFDEKTGLMKQADTDEKLKSWGRDSESAPRS